MKIIFLLSLLFTSVLSFANPIDLSVCRANIPKLMCWVDPVSEEELNDPNYVDTRPCLLGGEKFAFHFEGHFDRSTDLIKKMYCHLNKILIEKSFPGSAYGYLIKDKNKVVTGGAVGVRQEILDFPLAFDQWLSWKEETSFGEAPALKVPHLG